MLHDVAVVGGGIAGLSCAWRVHSAGHEVIVLEEKAHPGGNVRTERAADFRVECGPHTFMGSADDVFTLAEETGVSDEIVATRPSASKRFIVHNGRLHAVPSGPFTFLASGLLSFRAKLELAGEPFRTLRGSEGDTALEFFERRFGKEAARVLAGAFISGVYAGDPASLSAPAAFPLFWRFEQESGGMIRGALRLRKERKELRKATGGHGKGRNGLFTFKGGLGGLSAAVASRLGERVRTDSPVGSISRDNGSYVVCTPKEEIRCRRLVLAVPPNRACRLAVPLDGDLGGLLNEIPMAPVAVVHLGYASRAERVPDGFGFLAPRGEGVRSLGVLFPSRLFEDRTPEGGDLLTAFVGGVKDPEALDLSDNELLDVVLEDLKKLTGFGTEPDVFRVARVRQAIPQFTMGHLERMSGIRGRLAHLPGLLLAGNYMRGVGMKDAVSSGFEAASLVDGQLRG